MRAKLDTPSARLESLRYWRRTVLGLAVTGALTWSAGAWFYASAAPITLSPHDCGGGGREVPVPGCTGLHAAQGSLEFRAYSWMCSPASPVLESVGLGGFQGAGQGHFALADHCLETDELVAMARSPQAKVRHYAYRRANTENAWAPELVELALFDGEPIEKRSGCSVYEESGREIALRVLAGD
jgi:hypothetical protein